MEKILLVDDEPGELNVLGKCLNCEDIKAEILSVSSGMEALELIKKKDINLLVTDIHMPEMNGLELILAASKEIPDLAFIVLTGYATAEIQRYAMLKGCLRFVEKPYKVDEIRKAVSEALAAQQGFSATMVGIDITDLIQLNCLSGNSAALKVTEGGKSGMIFFDRGNIVHALVDDIEGEEAFYQIMTFSSGNIENRKNVKSPTQSIENSHVALMIEGCRRRDEALNIIDSDR